MIFQFGTSIHKESYNLQIALGGHYIQESIHRFLDDSDWPLDPSRLLHLVLLSSAEEGAQVLSLASLCTVGRAEKMELLCAFQVLVAL
jgi:hypothetical protein